MFLVRRRRARLALTVLVLFLLAGLVALPVAAFEFRNGETVVINQNELVDDDLFISGTTVIVNGTVNGDLWAAGNTVQVNGTVNGSVFMAGQSLTLNGRVTGSLYAAGAGITLGPEAVVQRNTYGAGYALQANPGSTVGRDLAMAGGQAQLAGTVTRDVAVAANALEISGRVGRNVNAVVGDPNRPVTPGHYPNAPAPIAPGIRVAPSASIGGKLTYRSPVEQSGNIRATPGGGVTYVPEPGRRPLTFGAQVALWFLARLREFLTLILLGLLVSGVAPRLFDVTADQVEVQPLLSLGWGVVWLLAGYAGAVAAFFAILIVAALLGLITLGGLAWVVGGLGLSALALAFVAFQAMVTFGSKLVVAYLVGRLLFHRDSRYPLGERYWPLVVGILIYVFASGIPFIGVAVAVVATLLGLGSSWLAYQAWPQPRRRT